MSSNTRPTLLKRLGDAADALAWDEFFQRYWPLIYALARRRGCSEHTAEEIVQEVMLNVFRGRDLFQYDPQRGRFRDWLAAVVRNAIVTYRRRPDGRVRAEGVALQPAPIEPEAEGQEPDESWETMFERALLAALLDVVRREVNPRDYLAFELLAVEELSGAEAARITGLTRNAAYKARRRVMRRLKALAGTYADDGRLKREVAEALRLRPAAVVERSMTTRMQQTMQSRWEPSGQ